jgi:hypothetical protein
VILTNFEFSEEAVLPPQVLRITLDSLYRAEGKFKLGEIVLFSLSPRVVSLAVSCRVVSVCVVVGAHCLLKRRKTRLKRWKPSSKTCTNV